MSYKLVTKDEELFVIDTEQTISLEDLNICVADVWKIILCLDGLSLDNPYDRQVLLSQIVAASQLKN